VSAVEVTSGIALETIDLSSASLDVGKRLNGKLILTTKSGAVIKK
jgi:hypothetical protein